MYDECKHQNVNQYTKPRAIEGVLLFHDQLGDRYRDCLRLSQSPTLFGSYVKNQGY